MVDYNINDIEAIRRSIDDIDDQILGLINRRLELALEIGKVKAQTYSDVLDGSREIRVFKRLADANKGPISNDMLRQIFTQIMGSSKELQRHHRVSYLGPAATFTHIAAMAHFGNSVYYIPQPSIRDIFEDVEKGSCHYGVVPVENSIEGAINHTLDLFYESELKICAERYQPISHDLLSGTGSLKDIQVIYSHPQPFAQCRKWLEKYLPHARLEECGSTSLAAKKATEQPNSAAIASREAAHMYNLAVVASRIEDYARNTTRFLIIGKDHIERTGCDKTSIMFVTSHIPGALYRILQPISEAKLNMLKLESRPTKHQNWSYFFFMDVEGHIDDPKIKETMDIMKSICLYFKFLGSYPRVISAE